MMFVTLLHPKHGVHTLRVASEIHAKGYARHGWELVHFTRKGK